MTEPTVNVDFYSPRFKIEIKGKTLPPDAVISVEIDESIEKSSMFTLNINEGLDMETQQFTWLESDLIKFGNGVEISLGYANSLKTLIKGKINEIAPGFSSSGIPSLKLTGYDLSHPMKKKKESRFKDKEVKYSEIAKDIAKENGLKSAEIDDTKKKHNVVKRNNKDESDYALLNRLAKKEEIDYEFFVRDDGLYFRKPRYEAKETITFKFGKNIVNFNPRLNPASILKEVTVRGWSKGSKKPIEATLKLSDIIIVPAIFGKIIGESEEKRIERRVLKDEDEAKKIAAAELKRGINNSIVGTLTCIGNQNLRPGMTVMVEKIGGLFSGKYYINSAKHSVSDSGYSTSLEVRRCFT